jgi:hypothetical protein
VTDGGRDPSTASTEAAALPSKAEARMHLALRGIAGASLVDPSLALHSDGYAQLASDRDLRRLLEVLGELHRKTVGTFAIADVFEMLGDDSARELVSGLVAEASAADGAFQMFEQNAQTIARLCESLHHEEQLRLLRAGEAVDTEKLRALEEMRRARFSRGQHV